MFFNPLFIQTPTNEAAVLPKQARLNNTSYLFSDIIKVSSEGQNEKLKLTDSAPGNILSLLAAGTSEIKTEEKNILPEINLNEDELKSIIEKLEILTDGKIECKDKDGNEINSADPVSEKIIDALTVSPEAALYINLGDEKIEIKINKIQKEDKNSEPNQPLLGAVTAFENPLGQKPKLNDEEKINGIKYAEEKGTSVNSHKGKTELLNEEIKIEAAIPSETKNISTKKLQKEDSIPSTKMVGEAKKIHISEDKIFSTKATASNLTDEEIVSPVEVEKKIKDDELLFTPLTKKTAKEKTETAVKNPLVETVNHRKVVSEIGEKEDVKKVGAPIKEVTETLQTATKIKDKKTEAPVKIFEKVFTAKNTNSEILNHKEIKTERSEIQRKEKIEIGFLSNESSNEITTSATPGELIEKSSTLNNKDEVKSAPAENLHLAVKTASSKNISEATAEGAGIETGIKNSIPAENADEVKVQPIEKERDAINSKIEIINDSADNGKENYIGEIKEVNQKTSKQNIFSANNQKITAGEMQKIKLPETKTDSGKKNLYSIKLTKITGDEVKVENKIETAAAAEDKNIFKNSLEVTSLKTLLSRSAEIKNSAGIAIAPQNKVDIEANKIIFPSEIQKLTATDETRKDEVKEVKSGIKPEAVKSDETIKINENKNSPSSNLNEHSKENTPNSKAGIAVDAKSAVKNEIKATGTEDNLKADKNQNEAASSLGAINKTAPSNSTLFKTTKEQVPIKKVKVDELIKEVSHFISKGEKSSITLKITPENLGKVKVILDAVDKTMHAHIEVENDSVKQIMQNNLDHLKQSLVQTGINLTSINISLSNSDQKTFKQFSTKKKFNIPGKEEAVKEIISSAVPKNYGYNTYDYLA